MALQMRRRYTPEEYLALEREADHKSEYLNGAIFAMAGASREHNLIAGNVSGELRARLKGRLESLAEYVMIAQDKVRVERYVRRGGEWLLTEFSNLDETLRLSSTDCELPLREIYDRIELPGPDTEPSDEESAG